jgi:hypothetical protein
MSVLPFGSHCTPLTALEKNSPGPPNVRHALSGPKVESDRSA